MTIALTIIIAGAVLIAFGLTARHYAEKVIDEILAAELRQIDREQKARQYDANLAARWQS